MNYPFRPAPQRWRAAYGNARAGIQRGQIEGTEWPAISCQKTGLEIQHANQSSAWPTIRNFSLGLSSLAMNAAASAGGLLVL